MKKWFLVFALLLLPNVASAQCTGVFQPNTLCGNLTGSPAPPSQFSASGTVVGPNSSTPGDVAEWNNSAGTLLKDVTPTAVIDQLCSTNNDLLIRLSGTWQCGATGTSGHTIPFLDGNNTASGNNTESGQVNFSNNSPQVLGNPIRIPLAATTAFFVNADGSGSHACGAFTCSAGSDSNNGLSNTTPWQTIQHSVSTMVRLYDFAAQTVNLQTADGTYNECVALPSYLATTTSDKNVFILGHSGSVGSVTVNCASGNAFTAVNSPQGWVLKNLTVIASNDCIVADYHSSIYWDGGAFGACTAYQAQAENAGSFIEFISNYTVTGSAAGHANAVNGGVVIWGPVTVTNSGTPAFSPAGLISNNNGGIIDDTNLTVSGAFTGPKYNLTGRALTFSTGSTASTSNSTQYIGASSISATENNYYLIGTTTNKIVQLIVNVETAPSAGQTFTYTLRIGAADTALTCVISGTSTTCSDTTHSAGSIVPSSVIDVKVVSSATAATSIMQASVVMQ